MAATSLLYTVTKSKIDSLELDASISETHSATVDVTEHPVESGFNIADHARPAAESIALEGFVSNTPWSTDVHTESYTDEAGRTFEWQSKSTGDANRASAALQTLRTLKDSGAVITVVTGLRSYENMVMTSLNIPRDAQTANGLRFTAAFKQIRTVTAQVAPTVDEPKTQKKRDLGKKATEPATFPKSVLDRVVDGTISLGKSLGL